MAEEKKEEPKVEGGLKINIGGLGLGNLFGLGNILKGLDIEKLVDAADRLADIKGDEVAKENVKKMREGIGQVKGKVDFETAKSQGLGGLISQLLNFVEKASKEGGEFTQEFAGGKGIIAGRFRTRTPFGVTGSGEKFEAGRHEPSVRKTEKKPVVEEKVQTPELDVFDEKDYVLISGDLPGVNTDEIKYKVEGNLLTIWTEGTRKYHQEIELPASVDTEKIELSYKNGVLEIKLPKRVESGEAPVETPKRKRGRPRKTA